MSIRAKVIGCFLILLFLFASVSVYNYARFRQANSRLVLVNELFIPVSRLVVQLQSHVHNVAEDLRRYYFSQNSGTPDTAAFSRAVRDLHPYLANKKFAQLEEVLSKEENQQLNAMVAELTTLVGRVKSTFNGLTRSTDRTQFEENYVRLRHDLKAISERLDAECEKLTLAAQNEGRESLISSILLSSLALLFGVVTVFLTQKALKPLPQLLESIRRIGSGDFKQSLKVTAADRDEISILAREYNTMLSKLSERDKKILEQQNELLQSERLAAVGQLSAEIVHEIRNPLNSISLNIDWLESELQTSNEDIIKTLRSLAKEITRLNQITESYLVRARVPSQEQEKTPVHDLLKEILDFTKEEDRARGIQITTHLAREEIFVRTDRSKLKQAFLNVFRNAKEAMPRGGKLVVRTELAHNVYRIHVCDSGYGMNEATKQQAFRPFFTTKANGSGLGLVLTKAIVEEAHGSLHCESRIGQGTTFTFQFPV